MATVSLSSTHFTPLSTTVKPSNSYRPMQLISMANPRSDPSYWTCLNTEIDTHLKQAIPIKPPLAVYEPMHHLTFAATQSSAPALCLADCELLGGGRREHALAAAAALRLMQAAAFTHENMPVTRPGAHHYGPNVELLTADGMVPFGFELLAGIVNDGDPDPVVSGRVLRVIIEISSALGSRGMIQGQYNELRYGNPTRGGGLVDSTWVDEVCRKKEGEIHGCAGACGAILGGGNEEEIGKLRRYGVCVGMIEGILKKVEEMNVKTDCYLKDINELRELALTELQHFNQRYNVGVISSLLENENMVY